MSSPEDTAQTTVYRDNARAGGRPRRCEPGWDAAIARLVERDYAFLPLRYGGAGMLFRGIASGLGAALAAGRFALSADAHALNALERETGVLFVSQDVSDALAVSRLWEAPRDGAILAIPAAHFARAHAAGSAAVLGFADPGVVFRYPCFAPPLELADVAHVIVHPAAATTVAGLAPGRALVLPRGLPRERTAVADALASALATAGVIAAVAENGARFPRPA
ncbi:MAG: hypothetical protein RLW61_14250 [Gammaproteobacteria bacterium]